MILHPPAAGRPRSAAAVALLLSAPLLTLLFQGNSCTAAEPATPNEAAPSQTLDLAACLNLALQHQPRIAAARASLAAAEDGKRALDSLHIPTIIDPELPIRRKQACLGVSAAAAALEQAEHDAVYAVTRNFYTVIFAREQERVARSVVDRLSAINEVARGQLQSGARDITTTDVNRTTVYLRLALTQQHKATSGVKRAVAALREAIGFGPEFQFEVASAQLPKLDVKLDLPDVIANALARRGEMARAAAFSEVTCLEVQAQGTGLHRRMETFAAGSDIHGSPVPLEEHNDIYKPGGIFPEMPTLLVGQRGEREKRASSFHARAEALVEGTRNLISLEAEDAFLRWEDASLEGKAAREATESGEQLAEDLSRDFNARLKVKVEDVVNARVLAAQARSRYNEALYHQILALADIERITAGGICAGLTELAGVRPQPAGAAPNK